MLTTAEVQRETTSVTKHLGDSPSDAKAPAVKKLRLNNQPVPPPQFREDVATWELYRKFSMVADNPYDVEKKPKPANFLIAEAPPTSTIKDQLNVDGLKHGKDLYMGHEDKTFAWTFDGVFTQQHCLELINMFNEKKFTPALTSNNRRYETGDPRKTDELEYDPKRRDTYIVMFDCPELSGWMWKTLESELKNSPVPEGWRVDHINSYMRGLCYCKANQSHPEHFDAMMKYPPSKYDSTHPYSKARSVMTIFVYLSGVPSGGATAFPQTNQKLTDDDLRCRPVPGRVLIFTQNLWHTGEPLKEDTIKYVIRSDVMAMPDDLESCSSLNKSNL